MSVAVIGGRGFYGRRVLELLGEQGIPATIASRTRGAGRVQVDLERPETLAALDDFETVINCSDSLGASPLALIERRLDKGGRLIEGTANLATIEAVLGRWPASASERCRGTVLLGMGIAPGLSNLLAAHLCRGVTPQRLVCAMRVSGFTAGGGGMARLMAQALVGDAVYFEDGQRRTGSPASVTARIPFADGDKIGLRVTLPESAMLVRSLSVRTISTYLVPEPQLMRIPIVGLARVMRPRFTEWMTKVMWLQRSVLLRGVVGSMRLGVLHRDRAAWLRASDGMRTSAAAIVASLDALDGAPRGVVLPDQCLTLPDMLGRIRALGCEVESSEGTIAD